MCTHTTAYCMYSYKYTHTFCISGPSTGVSACSHIHTPSPSMLIKFMQNIYNDIMQIICNNARKRTYTKIIECSALLIQNIKVYFYSTSRYLHIPKKLC